MHTFRWWLRDRSLEAAKVEEHSKNTHIAEMSYCQFVISNYESQNCVLVPRAKILRTRENRWINNNYNNNNNSNNKILTLSKKNKKKATRRKKRPNKPKASIWNLVNKQANGQLTVIVFLENKKHFYFQISDSGDVGWYRMACGNMACFCRSRPYQYEHKLRSGSKKSTKEIEGTYWK